MCPTLTLPPITKDDLQEANLDAFVLSGLLTLDECSTLIKSTERLGFSFWHPSCTRRDYRNADTVEVTHHGVRVSGMRVPVHRRLL